MWAAVFPGQGSQKPGMGKFLFDEFKLARELFEEASDSLSLDFKKLCFDSSEADLALTENTQPCLVLVSTVTFRVVQSLVDFRPQAAAGHSVGEYSALVAAGTLAFTDAVAAVRKRGQYMQSAVPVGVGGMVAVTGCNASQVTKLCHWVESETGDRPLEPANFNTPTQIVISGKSKLITWMTENFRDEVFAPEDVRCKFTVLKVSAPFHCSMMKPAEEKMAKVLNQIEFADARFPVLPNVTATPTSNGKELRQQLIRQISSPVRWVECIQGLKKTGVDRTIEFGCGRVLAGLSKKIDSVGLQTFNINSLDDVKSLESQLH